MGDTVKAFDALVLAGVAAVLGTVFLVGAMIGLLSGGDSITLVLADSVVASTVVGVLLLLTGGALGTDQRWARYLGIISFLIVVPLGFPSVSDPAVMPVVHTTVAVLATLYLLWRNPVKTGERSSVDESTSATKVGSTIR